MTYFTPYRIATTTLQLDPREQALLAGISVWAHDAATRDSIARGMIATALKIDPHSFEFTLHTS